MSDIGEEIISTYADCWPKSVDAECSPAVVAEAVLRLHRERVSVAALKRAMMELKVGANPDGKRRYAPSLGDLIDEARRISTELGEASRSEDAEPIAGISPRLLSRLDPDTRRTYTARHIHDNRIEAGEIATMTLGEFLAIPANADWVAANPRRASAVEAVRRAVDAPEAQTSTRRGQIWHERRDLDL